MISKEFKNLDTINSLTLNFVAFKGFKFVTIRYIIHENSNISH